jgi:hypothetical protein
VGVVVGVVVGAAGGVADGSVGPATGDTGVKRLLLARLIDGLVTPRPLRSIAPKLHPDQ